MPSDPELSPQMEDYLEAIYEQCLEDGFARIKDIAARLDVTNPSVVGAIKRLKQKKLVSQERYGYVRLTPAGKELAERLLHRHEVLSNFLEKVLGLDQDTASRDACRIEHAVSPETVERLRAAAEFIEARAHQDLEWSKEFRRFYRKQRGKEKK
jgi:DtxR family Mn-dependent transcriptional regulator